MLDVGQMVVVFGRLMAPEKQARGFDRLTFGGATALFLEGYDIQKGGLAELVLLQARTLNEASRLQPHRLVVIRRGKAIARGKKQSAEISGLGARVTIDFTLPETQNKSTPQRQAKRQPMRLALSPSVRCHERGRHLCLAGNEYKRGD